MRINQIHLKNFRCYEDVSIEFHPRFNVLVGINGTGKTSILEALRIAIGSLFLSVDKYKDKIASPGIQLDDVRLSNLEQQYPVIITTEGTLSQFTSDDSYENISWERSLVTKGGATRYKDAKLMKEASSQMQEVIRQSEPPINIPLIAYYSTDRFKKEKKDVGVEPNGSRLRGYYNALDPLTNIKFFLDLYYTETLSAIQHNTTSDALNAVNEAVKKCIDCDDLMFDIKQQELLLIQSKSHERMPFHMLSDGVRSVLAMVMEIAFRCYLLNPHLGKEAAMLTTGVILIDEIDLHLHPEWQKKVINDLRNAFPNIQFIITTHSPQILGEVDHDFNVYALSRNGSDIQVVQTTGMFGMDSNSILEDKMETDSVSAIIKQKTEEMYSLLELKDFDGAENIADEIDELTQNRNIDTVRARVIIRRGRYKNNDLSNP